MINKQTILRYLRSCYPNNDIPRIVSFTSFIVLKQEHIGILTIDKSSRYSSYEVRVKDIEYYISKQRDQLINVILND